MRAWPASKLKPAASPYKLCNTHVRTHKHTHICKQFWSISTVSPLTRWINFINNLIIYRSSYITFTCRRGFFQNGNIHLAVRYVIAPVRKVCPYYSVFVCQRKQCIESYFVRCWLEVWRTSKIYLYFIINCSCCGVSWVRCNLTVLHLMLCRFNTPSLEVW